MQHPQLLILGRGSAGTAIAQAARLLGWNAVSFLDRGTQLAKALSAAKSKGQGPCLLAIANPHALHASTLQEAQAAGFDGVLIEKPVCVTKDELSQLSSVRIPTAVLHGYRMMWGPQALRQMVQAQELGEVFSIEARYWQSSAAERALSSTPTSVKSWKTDPSLSGPGDVILDLAPHVLDLAHFVMGAPLTQVSCTKSFAGTDAPHRDTHIQIQAEFSPKTSAFFSISKIVHGASNQLEFSVLGTRGTAHWSFENPDQIRVGMGRTLQTRARETRSLGSGFPVYHGLGWIEGYIEILKQLEIRIQSEQPSSNKIPVNFPSLEDSLSVMKLLLPWVK